MMSLLSLEPLTKPPPVTLSPSATLRINSAKGFVFTRNEEILRFAQNDKSGARAVLLGTLNHSMVQCLSLQVSYHASYEKEIAHTQICSLLQPRVVCSL